MGLLILSLQQVLSIYVHKYFELLDIFILFFILILFIEQNEKIIKWLFIAGFVLGILKGVMISQRLGIASFFYMILAYNYTFYKGITKKNIQFILFILIAFVAKFVIYIALAFIFKDNNLLQFLLSLYFLQQIAFTTLFGIVVGMPVYWLINRIRSNV